LSVATGAEHGGSPGSREFRRFLNLRTELFEIDTRFGQIGGGAPGVFAALDKAGVLTHQVPGADNVEHAIENPPAIGRAQLRGRMVRQLAPNSGRYLCGWTGIIDRQDGCLLDLNDPFETAERWQPQQSSRASESFRVEVWIAGNVRVLQDRAQVRAHVTA
jgi:hypothetical protein